MSEETEKIINFHPDLPPLSTAPREQKCLIRCKRLVLDEHRRMVKCEDCGKVIDPFDWLYELARRKEYKLGSLASVEAEIKRKSAELSEVNRQLKNAKARLRRSTP